MGKGDKKSRKGKIAMGSHGVLRPRKKAKTAAPKDAALIKKAVAPKKVTDTPVAPKKVAAAPAAKKVAAPKKAVARDQMR